MGVYILHNQTLSLTQGKYWAQRYDWAVMDSPEGRIKWQCCKGSVSPLLGIESKRVNKRTLWDSSEIRPEFSSEIILGCVIRFFYIPLFISFALLLAPATAAGKASEWINFTQVQIAPTFASGLDHITLTSFPRIYFLILA